MSDARADAVLDRDWEPGGGVTQAQRDESTDVRLLQLHRPQRGHLIFTVAHEMRRDRFLTWLCNSTHRFAKPLDFFACLGSMSIPFPKG